MTPLPPLGMGCAGLGNLYRALPDGLAEATVAAALDAGIGYFDVAPHYGFGLAEERLGRALVAHPAGASALVSTKVGRLLAPVTASAGERHGFVDAASFEPVFDYGADAVRRSLDASRERLGREWIGLVFAHDLGERTHGADAERHWRDFLDGGYPALRALRDAGVIGGIGLGVNEIAACERLLDEVPVDAILLAGRYTLLEQEEARPLLDRCARAGVRVIVGGPYNSGVLVEGARGRFDYASPPPEVLARVETLERTCAAFDVPLAAAALQFPSRHPAVASVIPGPVGPDQVAATIRYAEWSIPDELWDACATALEPAA